MEGYKNIPHTISTTLFDDIPSTKNHQIKLSLLDTIGVAIMSKEEADYSKLLQYISSSSEYKRSCIWGSKQRVSPASATFLNTYAAHRGDFDSILYGTFGHPPAILYPALLSVFDYKEISGERLLKSIYIGLESMATLGRVVGADLKDRKFHPTAALGGLAVSSALGWMLEFDEEKLKTSFNLTGASISGFKSSFGTVAKPYQVAVAGREAVSTSLIVENDFMEVDTDNWFENLLLLSNKEEINTATREFGDFWILDEFNFLYKFHPCCGYFHQTMNGLIDFFEQTKVERTSVQKIQLILPEFINVASIFQFPKSVDEGKFSILFNLSLILTYKNLALEHYTQKEIENSIVKDNMKKINIKYIADEAALGKDGELHGDLTLKLLDGSEVSTTIQLTDNGSLNESEKVYSKFEQCTKAYLNSREVDRYIDFIMNIEKVSSLDWAVFQEEISFKR